MVLIIHTMGYFWIRFQNKVNFDPKPFSCNHMTMKTEVTPRNVVF